MNRLLPRAATLGLAALLAAALPAPLRAQEPPSRRIEDLNWMEIAELVPARVKTVLLTTGTVEPHGVINNGADNIAPIAIAVAIAQDVNALVGAHLAYGVTGSMAAYPGATYIPAEVYGPFIEAILTGFVRNGFRNIIIINGHGGPQTAVLNEVAGRVALEQKVNTLVINWWSTASQAAIDVFGNTGGHAAVNETAMVQAIAPKLVHPEWVGRVTVTANPPAGAWSAVPAPSPVTLYVPGEGWPPDFDQKKADTYFQQVVAGTRDLVLDVLRKWERAGF